MRNQINIFNVRRQRQIYRRIPKPQFRLWLQRDLDCLQPWSVGWGLTQIYKNFTHSRWLYGTHLSRHYRIGDTLLNSVDEIRDLGVLLDSKLPNSIEYHILWVRRTGHLVSWYFHPKEPNYWIWCKVLSSDIGTITTLKNDPIWSTVVWSDQVRLNPTLCKLIESSTIFFCSYLITRIDRAAHCHKSALARLCR